MAAALTLQACAFAADYPDHAITMIVPAAAGGVVDITARGIQPGMSEILGQALVILNRPGAGGHIGNAMAAKANGDGYTILASAGSYLLSGVYRNLQYDPINDFVPIGMVATSGFILVVPANSPFKTIQDLVDYGRAHPGELNYASSGVGNSTHIGAEMLAHLTGIKLTHVPYKGSVNALTDLIAGRIDFFLDNQASSMPHLKSGDIRALGVTSARRLAELPDVPSIGEVVKGYQIEGWTGLFAPRSTDPAIVKKLSDALKATLDDPKTASIVSRSVGEAYYMNPGKLAQFMKEDHQRLSTIVQAANIVVE